MAAASGLQLEAAVMGDLRVETDKARKAFQAAAQKAVFEAANDFQGKRRSDWAASGIRRGNFLAKTIRLERYPNGGTSPAALVYSTIPVIEQAFDIGATIRSKEGWFLLIPNPEVWGTNRVALPRRRGADKRILAIAEARFGKLKFVYRRNGLSLLVTEVRESKSQPGTFKHASKRALASKKKNGLVTVIVFFLVRQAKLKRRLHVTVLKQRAGRDMQSKIAQKFAQYFDEGVSKGPIAMPDKSGE